MSSRVAALSHPARDDEPPGGQLRVTRAQLGQRQAHGTGQRIAGELRRAAHVDELGAGLLGGGELVPLQVAHDAAREVVGDHPEHVDGILR